MLEERWVRWGRGGARVKWRDEWWRTDGVSIGGGTYVRTYDLLLWQNGRR